MREGSVHLPTFLCMRGAYALLSELSSGQTAFSHLLISPGFRLQKSKAEVKPRLQVGCWANALFGC